MPVFLSDPAEHRRLHRQSQLKEDTAAARQLLAEAGYPDGKKFPAIEVLFNTVRSHKAIAEALQQMWKKNLNINVRLRNEEWKVYLDSTRTHGLFHRPRRLVALITTTPVPSSN